jgi:PrcB C-terminal
MMTTRSLLTGLLLSLLISLPALAAEPTPIHDGDRISGELQAPGGEVGFVIDALEGTVLALKAKASGGSSLEPEILLYGPDDVRMQPASRYRHKLGSPKAKLRRMPLPMTGRYTIVVRAAGVSSGAYVLKVLADHPVRFRERGALGAPGAAAYMRFPAFEGTRMRLKISGRDGFLPSVDRLLLPEVKEATLADVVADGAVVTSESFTCSGLGDYRLPIEGRDGTTGAWKGKIKLTHPGSDPRRLVVDGMPAGTFTSELQDEEDPDDPSDPPQPPPGLVSWRILQSGDWSDIQTPREAVARTSAEYNTLWSQHHKAPTFPTMPPAPPPTVDFSTEIVVGMFLGIRPTGGYTARVKSVTTQGSGILVTYEERKPGPGVPVTQSLTYPYVVIAVDRTAGPVTFSGPTVVVYGP